MKRRLLPALIGLVIGALAAVASIAPSQPTTTEYDLLIDNP